MAEIASILPTSDIQGEAERAGSYQSREEKAQGKSQCA